MGRSDKNGSSLQPSKLSAAESFKAEFRLAQQKKSNGSSSSSSTTTTTRNTSTSMSTIVLITFCAVLFIVSCHAAYRIRMQAIDEYGMVIHEYDPYFNYRAAEYLYEHGTEKFFTWFDYQSWWPLGRPVGTTIYPGLQFTAVWIKQFIFSQEGGRMTMMSINDICCMIPVWFGVIASIVVGLLTYECAIPINSSSHIGHFVMDLIQGRTNNDVHHPTTSSLTTNQARPWVCAVLAMAMMSIVPAHLMRSVGGGFDQESVAVTAMNATFYFWIRSLRPSSSSSSTSYWYAMLAAVSYFAMASSWGGYIFVLNLIGLHALLLVLLGRFSSRVWKAYSLFYMTGTALVMQIPVVGMTPLKSLEQLGPCAVFGGYQLLQICEVLRKRRNLSRREAWKLRIQVALGALGVAILLMVVLLPKGYLGPLSSRVRGLFVPHTKTGNPLVDSVAEHKAARSSAYYQYLHMVCWLAPVGFVMTFFHLSDASSFLLLWGIATYFFSLKMVRLILLTAPVASTLGGLAAGRIVTWCVHQLLGQEGDHEGDATSTTPSTTTTSGRKQKKRKHASGNKSSSAGPIEDLKAMKANLKQILKTKEGVTGLKVAAGLVLLFLTMNAYRFIQYSWEMRTSLSIPAIITKGRTARGDSVTIDDYRQAYWWLRDETPEDARIMAWWDYGYQITSIANRTTLADGNTWNHEHIALLGKALTSNLEEGYEIVRNMADYVLIWVGVGGDDLRKSPHITRIANSVYRGHCPGDPTCGQFGFVDDDETPSPMMERSLLYQLHRHRRVSGVFVNEDMFEEVFDSKYHMVRIFKVLNVSQESKDWVADPANRKCDVPGSWYCPGQYPPALQEILAHKTDFTQLEDFNKQEKTNTTSVPNKNVDDEEEYQRQYFENLKNPNSAEENAETQRIETEKWKQQQRAAAAKRREKFSRTVVIGSNGDIVSDGRPEQNQASADGSS